MGKERNWTPEDKQYLSDNWGTVSMPTLMAKLNRSKNSIEGMKNRLKLGAFLDNGEYVTFNQLLHAIGYTDHYSSGVSTWINKHDFPVKYKRVNHNRFRVVYLEDFWEWAQKNQGILDFSRFEENNLGAEPNWVKVKRSNDYRHRKQVSTAPWSPAEDAKLIRLLKQRKFGYMELSNIFRRSCGAIQRRCFDLNIEDRPVKADNQIKWTEGDFETLGTMIKAGYRYPTIANAVGRSDKAIRGLVFRNYLTENLDKVREFIGNGSFGDNKPVKRIKDWNCMSGEEKAEVRELMTRLVAILRFEYKQFFEDCDFWQKDICQLWDGYCTAGEHNCDSCISFQRIQPQYCKRCGGTFYERHQELICKRCREQRIRQYMRKKTALIKCNG